MAKFLQEGDIFRLEKGMKVYAELQERFVYSNTPESTKLCRTDLSIGQFDEYPVGEYVVIKTTYDGGQTGGGMNGHDDWPNGHHVFCQKLNSHDQLVGNVVDFYQSGCFTAMNENIKPVGKMIKQVTWKRRINA